MDYSFGLVKGSTLKSIRLILTHLFLWVGALLAIHQIFPVYDYEIEFVDGLPVHTLFVTHPYNSLVFIFFSAFIFYFNSFWLFPKLLVRRRVLSYILSLSLLVVVAAFLQYQVDLFIISQLGEPPHEDYEILNGYYAERVGFNVTGLIFFNSIVFSLGFAFFINWSRDQSLKRRIIRDRVRAENRLLRQQINPHFLFNTLNTFFSLAQKHHVTEIEEGLATLSEIFRYSLENDQASKVSLSKELDYIRAFIYLQSLRFKDGTVDIRFDVKGDPGDAKMHQMILINFVENAFKHGINTVEQPFVHVFISIDGGLELKVKNSIGSSSSPKASFGLGLKNVKERLNLLYPESHSLEINVLEGIYEVRLTLKSL